MSLFKKIKKAFSGGVKTSIEVPDSFSWNQDSLPVTITFTGTGESAAEIERITFTVRGIVEAGEQNQNNPYLEWQEQADFSVAPEAEEVRQFDMPLPSGTVDTVNSRGLNELKKLRQVELVIAIKVAGVKITGSKHRKLKVVEFM